MLRAIHAKPGARSEFRRPLSDAGPCPPATRSRDGERLFGQQLVRGHFSVRFARLRHRVPSLSDTGPRALWKVPAPHGHAAVGPEGTSFYVV
jgi:hypothetical protein